MVVGLLICSFNCEARDMDQTRPSALAGTWYPSNPEELARSIDEHLEQGRPLAQVASALPLALITPHAGHRFSGDAAGQAFRLLQGEPGRAIDRVVLIGPSHHQAFQGASIMSVEAYETPLGRVPLDIAVIEALLDHPLFQSLPGAHRPEHCLEIELPFLQRVLRHPYRLVPILISTLEASGWREMAEALMPHLDDGTLIVISSDFCHYGGRFGYLPFRDRPDENLKRLDKGALQAIVALDAQALAAYKRDSGITVCGIRPIGVLLELLRLPDLQARWGGGPPEARVLDYYRSADLLGDFDGSVSYASVAFFRPNTLLPGPVYPPRLEGVVPWGETHGSGPEASGEVAPGTTLELSPAEKDYLLGLARDTLARVLRGEEPPDPRTFPAGVSASKMALTCGVFVTLNKGGNLRGCIGHIVGRDPLARGVISNAISAARHDPRFPPVTLDELGDLHIEISVLTPLEEVSGPEQIEVGRHGVVLERAGKRAVFLPQVAPEWGWDRDTMLDRLSMKAGLPREAWRSGTTFQVFEALVFEEEK